MTRRDPMVYIFHMMDYSHDALDMAQGHSRTDMDNNAMLNLALQKVIQIISASASQVPDDLRRSHPEVPWEDAESFYRHSVKSYDNVNLDSLWDTIQYDIPLFYQQREYLIAKEDSQ